MEERRDGLAKIAALWALAIAAGSPGTADFGGSGCWSRDGDFGGDATSLSFSGSTVVSAGNGNRSLADFNAAEFPCESSDIFRVLSDSRNCLCGSSDDLLDE